GEDGLRVVGEVRDYEVRTAFDGKLSETEQKDLLLGGMEIGTFQCCLLGLELADQIVVGIGSVIRDHLQRLARTTKHHRNNPLMEQNLCLRGMFLDERLDLSVFEVDADSRNTNGHSHVSLPFLSDISHSSCPLGFEWTGSETNVVSRCGYRGVAWAVPRLRSLIPRRGTKR